jgi:hypothetical protein
LVFFFSPLETEGQLRRRIVFLPISVWRGFLFGLSSVKADSVNEFLGWLLMGGLMGQNGAGLVEALDWQDSWGVC